MNDHLEAVDAMGAGLVAACGIGDVLGIKGTYIVECVGADGAVKWTDTIHNLVTTVGKNSILDKFLDLGAAHTAIHMGLKGTGSAAAGDTMASHAGWLEVGGTNAPAYSGTRKVPAFSAAASGSKATSAAVSFGITSSGTVAGCFIVVSGTSAQDNTTGTLLSAGDFTGGSRAVVNGDTLNVTYSLAI